MMSNNNYLSNSEFFQYMSQIFKQFIARQRQSNNLQLYAGNIQFNQENMKHWKMLHKEKFSSVFQDGDFGNQVYIILRGQVVGLVKKEKQLLDLGLTKTDPIEQDELEQELNQINLQQKQKTDLQPVIDNCDINKVLSLDTSMKLLKTFEAGDLFGEIALLTNFRRNMSAICSQNSDLLVINKEGFIQIFNGLIKRLQELMEFMNNYNFIKDTSSSSILKMLLYDMRCVTLSSKFVVYKEHDPVDYFYFIKEGEIELSKSRSVSTYNLSDQIILNTQETDDGQGDSTKLLLKKPEQKKRIQLYIKSFNTYFGEEEILKNIQQRTMRATVKSQSADLIIIPKETIRQFWERNGMLLKLLENQDLMDNWQQQNNYISNARSNLLSVSINRTSLNSNNTSLQHLPSQKPPRSNKNNKHTIENLKTIDTQVNRFVEKSVQQIYNPNCNLQTRQQKSHSSVQDLLTFKRGEKSSKSSDETKDGHYLKNNYNTIDTSVQLFQRQQPQSGLIRVQMQGQQDAFAQNYNFQMNDQYRAITHLKQNVLKRLSESIEMQKKNQHKESEDFILSLLQQESSKNPNPTKEIQQQKSGRSQSVKNNNNNGNSKFALQQINNIRLRVITNQGSTNSKLPELDHNTENVTIDYIKYDNNNNNNSSVANDNSTHTTNLNNINNNNSNQSVGYQGHLNSLQLQKKKNKILEQYSANPQNYYTDNMKQMLSDKENREVQTKIERQLLRIGSREIDIRSKMKYSKRKNTVKLTEEFIKQNKPILKIADSTNKENRPHGCNVANIPYNNLNQEQNLNQSFKIEASKINPSLVSKKSNFKLQQLLSQNGLHNNNYIGNIRQQLQIIKNDRLKTINTSLCNKSNNNISMDHNRRNVTIDL